MKTLRLELHEGPGPSLWAGCGPTAERTGDVEEPQMSAGRAGSSRRLSRARSGQIKSDTADNGAAVVVQKSEVDGYAHRSCNSTVVLGAEGMRTRWPEWTSLAEEKEMHRSPGPARILQ